ncbi:MFS transporter [Streptomyces sp. B1866]|uniref:MFS transporter n=1 Tax=Streptomyces sp. B1866 TaxID=3075431 RepID=UPI00288FC3BE|nr:MFS transporter [Streptomyces sp. B1866]MDT3396388.1 MFS transporter [Streptomyces sp. B1866]
MTVSAPAVPADGERDPAGAGAARQWRIVAVAVLAQTLVLLDNTVLNIAMETLADPVRGLGAGSSDLAWAVASYSLVFAAGSFAGGALADRYGPRRTLIAGLAVLAAASLLAARSPNVTALVVTRGAMGAGGALITPATLALVTRHTSRAVRTRAIAVWASSGGAAVALGPVVGGALLAHFWWGSVFLLNLPVAAVCLAGAAFWVPEARHPGGRVLDLPGLALSVLGLGLTVYGVIQGGRRPGWSSPVALVPLAAGLALLALFVVVQRRRAQPSLDVTLFAEPRFAGGSVTLLLLFLGLAGQLFSCAFYLQGVRGLSPPAAGAVMASAAGGIVLGNQVSPALTRLLTVRWSAAAGILLTSATFAGFLFFDAETPVAWPVLTLFAQGAGVGLVVAPMTTEMMAALPPRYTGAGAAVAAAARPVGSTLGVAVLGSVLATAYRRAVRPALDGLPPASRSRALDSAEATRALARKLDRPDLLAAANRAYLHAMYVTAVWTALLSLIGAVLVIGYFRPREPTLGAQRGHRTAPPADPADGG